MQIVRKRGTYFSILIPALSSKRIQRQPEWGVLVFWAYFEQLRCYAIGSWPISRSIVVPYRPGDLFFVMIEELVLRALAVEVLHAYASQMTRPASPLPSGLGGEVAAEVVGLADVAV